MCKYCETSESQRKKMTTPKGIDEWYEENSLVKEGKNSCTINVFRWAISQKDTCFDDQLGLVAFLLLHDIQCKLDSKKDGVFVFIYDKKYTKKIKNIEKAYFSGKIQVDAKQMSKAVLILVNRLIKEKSEKNIISSKKLNK